ncbi:MAG: hypothetical protein JJT76_12945 [Clostridiaceae bacterium]|nr:hypothetical protein [Clostridiaceae bacterium]
MLQEIGREILLDAILGLLAVGGAYAMVLINKLAKKLQKETEKLDNEDKSRMLEAAIGRLEDTTLKTVKKIEEKTAKELRKAVQSGNASREELVALSREAYGEIIEIMGPQYMEILEEGMGNIHQYISNAIEEKVESIKAKQ